MIIIMKIINKRKYVLILPLFYAANKILNNTMALNPNDTSATNNTSTNALVLKSLF